MSEQQQLPDQQQSQVSQQARVILSLLKEVEDDMTRLLPQAASSVGQAEALLNGDLRLGRQQASALSGEERNILLGKALMLEGQIRWKFLSTVSGHENAELNKAAALLEEAYTISGEMGCQMMLGSVYVLLGEWTKAKVALEKIVATGDPEIAMMAQKQLLRLEGLRQEAQTLRQGEQTQTPLHLTLWQTLLKLAGGFSERVSREKAEREGSYTLGFGCLAGSFFILFLASMLQLRYLSGLAILGGLWSIFQVFISIHKKRDR